MHYVIIKVIVIAIIFTVTTIIPAAWLRNAIVTIIVIDIDTTNCILTTLLLQITIITTPTISPTISPTHHINIIFIIILNPTAPTNLNVILFYLNLNVILYLLHIVILNLFLDINNSISIKSQPTIISTTINLTIIASTPTCILIITITILITIIITIIIIITSPNTTPTTIPSPPPNQTISQNPPIANPSLLPTLHLNPYTINPSPYSPTITIDWLIHY